MFRGAILTGLTIALFGTIAIGERPRVPGIRQSAPSIQVQGRYSLPPIPRTDLDAQIIKIETQYVLKVTNRDLLNGFIGIAEVSFPGQKYPGEVSMSIRAGETLAYILPSDKVTGDQYIVAITGANGSLVFHKMARIKAGDEPVAKAAETRPAPVELIEPPASKPEPAAKPSGFKVKTRMTGGKADTDPYKIIFDMSSPSPIVDAKLLLTAKGLNEKRALNFTGATTLEIKLSDDLELQTLVYKILSASGEVLASGEADMAQLVNAEAATIVTVKPDKLSYKPGESAVISVELNSSSQNGMRIEVLAKDTSENAIFRDVRRQSKESAPVKMDFTIQIPKEVKGSFSFEIKAFEAVSNSLIDANTREIPIDSNQ